MNKKVKPTVFVRCDMCNERIPLDKALETYHSKLICLPCDVKNLIQWDIVKEQIQHLKYVQSIV